MARKKITIQRETIKPVKKKRKLSEEAKEKLRNRLAEMRAKKKPAEYKNISKRVLDLPDDDKYSFKNVKEWIKESKDKVAELSKIARSIRSAPLEKQKAAAEVDHKKAYIRYCEYYLKTGDWISMFSGANESQKVVPRCVAMAYHPDGRPKRSIGIFYPDINAIWTQNMEENIIEESIHVKGKPVVEKLTAVTDKQFTANL